jgi:glycosyltransferase involved in cell wall biosynthesis
MKKKRVAFLVGVPTPYREPLFKRLAESSRYDIRVLYCRERQPDQEWNLAVRDYPAVFLKNLSPVQWKGRFFISDINPGVCRELRAFSPDAVVVHGYNTLTALLAIGWCKRRGIPVLMRSDSNVMAEPVKTRFKLMVKRRFLAWLTKQVSVFLTIGKMNSAYWQHYGASPDRLLGASLAIDINYFSRQAAHYRADRERIRAENGWQSAFLLLYVGRLVPVKRVDVLIEAVRLASADGLALGLLVVGDGTERRRLEEQARSIPQVHFVGFKEWRNLPMYYGIADLFVLPSEVEPWGLVINEAMASGLPVVAVRTAGAAGDLIVEGQNGFLVPAGDAATLASLVKQVCINKDYLSTLGKNAQVASQAWSYSTAAQGIDRALMHCLGTGLQP